MELPDAEREEPVVLWLVDAAGVFKRESGYRQSVRKVHTAKNETP